MTPPDDNRRVADARVLSDRELLLETHQRVERIDTLLFGNGREGLETRVVKLEAVGESKTGMAGLAAAIVLAVFEIKSRIGS